MQNMKFLKTTLAPGIMILSRSYSLAASDTGTSKQSFQRNPLTLKMMTKWKFRRTFNMVRINKIMNHLISNQMILKVIKYPLKSR